LEGRPPITTEGKNLASIDRFSTLQGAKTWRGAGFDGAKAKNQGKANEGEV